MSRIFSFLKDRILSRFSSVATFGIVDYIKIAILCYSFASIFWIKSLYTKIENKDLIIKSMTSYVEVLKEETKKEIGKEKLRAENSLKQYTKISTKQDESLTTLKDMFEKKQNELALEIKKKETCEQKVILFAKSKDEKDEIKIKDIIDNQ